ncbi:hypothetical protein ACJRO7_010099 [Eucalyptus globulus]|uniref:Uncharacterized protein n=1 Tax=Eucalyptus globulus TaxID=34317 RepID=A0ABD3LAW5_EUCGL
MSFPEQNGPKTTLLFFSCVSIETSLDSYSLRAAATASDALISAVSGRQQSGDLVAEQCQALGLLREQGGNGGVAVGQVGSVKSLIYSSSIKNKSHIRFGVPNAHA